MVMTENKDYKHPEIVDIKSLLVEAGKEALKQHLETQDKIRLTSTSALDRPATPTKKYVYGISGLAQIIGCSNPTAQKIKDSGRITFTKVGKKFIFDEDLVLSELRNNANLIPKS